MSKYKEVLRVSNNYIDHSTGELLDQTQVTKTVLVKDKEQFFTAFSRLVMSFCELDYAEAKVLVWCAANCELNTNQITLVKHTKAKLAKAMKMEEKTVGNVVTALVKKQYLERVATAVYMIDPELTWKGLLNERSKQVDVYLSYKIQNP